MGARLVKSAPARKVLADSRALKGGGAAGIATVGAAGVEVAKDTIIKTLSSILPLAPYLNTLPRMFIAAAIHAQIDDWNRGYHTNGPICILSDGLRSERWDKGVAELLRRQAPALPH